MSVSQTFAGLNRTKVLNDDGTVSWMWLKGLNALAQSADAPANSSNVPSSSTSAGQFGQMATDGTYLYIAVGASLWKRIALTSF